MVLLSAIPSAGDVVVTLPSTGHCLITTLPLSFGTAPVLTVLLYTSSLLMVLLYPIPSASDVVVTLPATGH